MASYLKEEIVEPLTEFARASRHLVDKCNKPDREGKIINLHYLTDL